MNCLNCGAPLELVDGQSVLSCPYCLSFRSMANPIDDADRVVSLDQPGGVDCPRCSRELVEASIDGRRAKLCLECRGVLIEAPIFAEVVRNRRATYRGAELRPQPIDPKSLQNFINCPNCRQSMDVHPHYGPGRAVMDSCHSCHLVWLDHSEMTSLERTPGVR